MTTWNKYTDALGVEQITKTDDDGTIWFVPADPSNSDYQKYLRWLENPNEEL